MPSGCGYAVAAPSTTLAAASYLFATALPRPMVAVRKHSRLAAVCARTFQPLPHSLQVLFTSVWQQVFPIIHTTNKNNKNFCSNNLLLISRKAVHI